MTHKEAYPQLPDLLWMRVADEHDVALRRHVDDCPQCIERLRELRRVHGALGDLDGVEVPESLERRVRDIPARYAQQAPETSPGGGARRALAAVAGIAAAAIAVVVLGLALLGGGNPAEDGPFRAVDEIAVGNATSHVGGRIEMGEANAGNRAIRLSVHGLEGSGERYQLWLAGESGEVSAGTFRPDKNGACIVLLSAPDAEWSQATIIRADSDEPPVVTVDL